MMMINYRNLAGGEVSYWDGVIYFWMEDGVYTVDAKSIQRHKCGNSDKEVTLFLRDMKTGFTKEVAVPCKGLDDFELIYRFISGAAACDCVRGGIVYGTTLKFSCNHSEPNRFVLRKMVIRGESSKCALKYKGYK